MRAERNGEFEPGPVFGRTGRPSRERTTVDTLGYWKVFAAVRLRDGFNLSERGAAMVEYALLVMLIAVVCILGIAFLGGNVSSKFQNVARSVAA